MTALREQGVFPPIYVALMNARDAYMASVNQFPKPSDRTTLRKQCDLITQHMRQILDAEGDAGAVVPFAWHIRCPKELPCLQMIAVPEFVRNKSRAESLSSAIETECGKPAELTPLYTHPHPARSGVVSDEMSAAVAHWLLEEYGILPPIGPLRRKIQEVIDAAIKSQGESNG